MASDYTPPYGEPDTIVANDSVQWLKTFTNFNPVTDTLSYTLMPIAGARINISAVNYGDGSTFWVNVAASITSLWVPGFYLWQAYMLDSVGNRHTLYNGRLTINPDFATASVGDYRSSVTITITNLYAVIQGKASSDQLHYSIRGRSLSRMSPKELTDWLDFYEELLDREIRREQMARGNSTKGKILARFFDPIGFPIPPGGYWGNKS